MIDISYWYIAMLISNDSHGCAKFGAARNSVYVLYCVDERDAAYVIVLNMYGFLKNLGCRPKLNFMCHLFVIASFSFFVGIISIVKYSKACLLAAFSIENWVACTQVRLQSCRG